MIEIVIAVTLLSLIVVTFIPIFNTSYKSIFDDGVKSQAMADISSKMDLLYTLDSVSSALAITNLFGATNITITTNPALLYVEPSNGNFILYRSAYIPTPGCSGYSITIVEFYQSGKYVSLTSFFKDKITGGV